MDNKTLSDLLKNAFDDSSFNDFCFNYFPEVHSNSSTGQPKNAKILALIVYCDQHLKRDFLLEKIQAERPERYAEATGETITQNLLENRKDIITQKITQITGESEKIKANKELQYITELLDLHKKGEKYLPDDPASGMSLPIPLEDFILTRLAHLEKMLAEILTNNLTQPKQTAQQKILFVYSNVTHYNGQKTSVLSPTSEYEAINTAYKDTQNPNFYLENITAITNDNFFEKIETQNPAILHISTHGEHNGCFYLTNDNDNDSTEIPADIFKERILILKDECKNLKIIFLASCHSHYQAEAIKDIVETVVFTKREITEDEATKYNKVFYNAILRGKNPQEAHNKALTTYTKLKECFGIFTKKDIIIPNL